MSDTDGTTATTDKATATTRLEPGDKAPDFTLDADDGTPIRLYDLLRGGLDDTGNGTGTKFGNGLNANADINADTTNADTANATNATNASTGNATNASAIPTRAGRIIIYFYPAAMTPGCTKEACDFRDNLNRLTAAGYTVVGISRDAPAKLARFRERDHLSFPLLSDPDCAVHRRYGAYGEKKLYGKTHVGVLRSTFVVDGDGTVLIARYNVRATGHVDSLLKQLAALG